MRLNYKILIMKKATIIPGDTVEYRCISGRILVKVLDIKKDGKIILNTSKNNPLVKPSKNGATTVKLIKNVSVLPSSVRNT